MSSYIRFLMLAMTVGGCALDPYGTVEPDRPFGEPAEEPAPTVPAETGDRPDCYPDVVYEIGGELVVAPGYCAERSFGRPVIGDPDPSVGWDDVTKEPADG